MPTDSEYQSSLNKFTQSDKIKRNRIFRFLGKLSDHERCKIIEKSLRCRYKYGDDDPIRVQYGLVFLFYIEFIKEAGRIERIWHKDLESAGTAENIRILDAKDRAIIDCITRTHKRKSGSRRSLQKYWAEILELRRIGHSWENIKKILEKKYQLIISRETIRKAISSDLKIT
ncbi:MAG: hypothetical protein PHP01_08075 [Phycisphaerae bacterium]|nr:hypothetical protein [Phycisphaerae bacterium]